MSTASYPTFRDIAFVGISLARQGHTNKLHKHYRRAFYGLDKQLKDSFRLVWWNNFVEHIVDELTVHGSSDLMIAAYRLMRPNKVQQLVEHRLGQIARQANLEGKYSLVRKCRQVMVAIRPEGTSPESAWHQFYKLTGIKVRHLPVYDVGERPPSRNRSYFANEVAKV